MKKDSEELYELLKRHHKHNHKAALAVMRGLTGEGQLSLLNDLRRAELELNGQASLALPKPPAARKPATKASGKSSKLPYSLLLPPSMLERLKALSEADGAPVSHHIRIAVLQYLDGSEKA